MNRILKFRAWNKGLKCMSEVLELDFQHDAIRCVPGHLPKNRISDCELMQFTGLLDKNGKEEIYEGDILQYKAHYPKDYQDKNPHKKFNRIGNGVKYSLKYGCYLLDDTYEKEPVFCGFQENEQWQVIGNIYENPELLNP